MSVFSDPISYLLSLPAEIRIIMCSRIRGRSMAKLSKFECGNYSFTSAPTRSFSAALSIPEPSYNFASSNVSTLPYDVQSLSIAGLDVASFPSLPSHYPPTLE
jgi:hypothetical protein